MRPRRGYGPAGRGRVGALGGHAVRRVIAPAIPLGAHRPELQVALRVADMARRSHMPILGVVENMSAFTTPDGTSWPLFGEGGGKRLAEEIDAPLLGSIPLEPAVSAGGDTGQPVAMSDGPASRAFHQIATRIVEEIAPPLDMAACSASVLNEVPVSLTGNRTS